MAACTKCGQKLGFGGKKAQKSRHLVERRVELLKTFKSKIEAQSDRTDAERMENFRRNIGGAIAMGETFAAQLHTVSHNMNQPGPDYGEMNRWMNQTEQDLRASAGH